MNNEKQQAEHLGSSDCSTEFWKDLDTQLMVVAAHRYALGRQSYIVGSAISWLFKHRKHFERNTIRVIVRDTVEALQDRRAGSQTIDEPGWENLASKLFNEMPVEDQNWVKLTVAYRGKDWPLSVG